jgi:tetratricopeptide (TPR) repeat protein
MGSKESAKFPLSGKRTSSDPGEEATAAVYRREARVLFAQGRRGDAYELLRRAVVNYPDDPFLLSALGYLTALLDGKYRNGIESCRKAIYLFERKVLLGIEDAEERQIAVLYLNLGRAYLAAGRRKDALEALQKGLRFDKQHKELLAERERLGVRRYVPVPFLDRSNPINAIIGRMFRKHRGGSAELDR